METDRAIADPSRWGALRVLRHRDFRLLWTGMFVLHALMPTQVATQVLYIQETAGEDSRLLLAGMLGAVRGGAMIFFGLVGGAFADRMDRRRLLILTQTTALAANAVVTAVIFVEPGSLLLTYVLLFMFTLVGSGAMAADIPTRQAMVPELVGRRDLPYGVAMYAVAMQLSFPLSLPLAGFLVGWFGYGGAYMTTLIGHGSLLLAVLAMHYRGKVSGRSPLPLLSEIREGLVYVRAHSAVMWTLLLVFAVMGLGFSIIASFGPVWMTRVMGLSPEGFGLISGLWGAGAVVASLSLANVGHFERKGLLLCASAVAMGACLIVYGYSRSIPVTAAANFGLGLLVTTTQVSAISLVQRIVPNEVQGRIMSLFMLNQGVAQLNGAPLGALAQAFTLERVVPAVGWLSLSATLLITLGRSDVRRSGALPQAVAAPASGEP